MRYDAFVNVSLEPLAQNQTFCAETNPTVADLVVAINGNGSNLRWYLSAGSSTPLSTTTALRAGTTDYYVSQETYPCGEGSRKKVTVNNGAITTTINTCTSYTWIANLQTYNQTGQYIYNNGCVVYTLNLNIDPIAVPEIAAQFRETGATLADITISGGQNITWYADAVTEDYLPNETTLETKTYYATQSISTAEGTDCQSGRVAVNITVGDIPDGFVYIPDAQFEQKLIELGLDDTANNMVLESNITSVTDLNLGGAAIKNLTGIGIGTNIQTTSGLLRINLTNGGTKLKEIQLFNTIVNICYNVKF